MALEIVFAIMWWLIVPTVDPLMHQVNPLLSFVGHVMFGDVVGLVAGSRAEQVTLATRRVRAA